MNECCRKIINESKGGLADYLGKRNFKLKCCPECGEILESQCCEKWKKILNGGGVYKTASRILVKADYCPECGKPLDFEKPEEDPLR